MTMYAKFGRDCWRYPLDIPLSTLGLYRGGTATPGSGTAVNAVLPAKGDYFALNNLVSINQRLFTQLTSLMGSALGPGTFTISAQDSASSKDIGQERIKLSWAGGRWALRPTTAPLLASILGFDPTLAEYRSDASGTIYAPYSYQGAWWSDNPWGGAAFVKLFNRISDTQYSSDRMWDALTIDWGEQQTRILQYDFLPSARIFRGRSLDPTRAALANIQVGDPNATFEPVWRCLQDSSKRVILHHDVEVSEGLGIGGRSWYEAVSLWNPQREYASLFTDNGSAGDYWRFEIALRIEPDGGGGYPR